MKRRKIQTKRRKINLSREVKALEGKLNEKFRVVELERRCLLVERNYNDLRLRLVNLLNREQIDAAKTCGITPEVYALEWIQIYKENLRKYAPAFGDDIRNLRAVKEQQYG